MVTSAVKGTSSDGGGSGGGRPHIVDSRRDSLSALGDGQARCVGSLPSRPVSARATTSMAEFFGMCASGDLAGVQAALNADPALSGALDQNLWSGVHHATKHGHTDVLEALLGACAAVLHDANANLNTGPNTHPTSIMAQALALPSTPGRTTIAPRSTSPPARWRPSVRPSHTRARARRAAPSHAFARLGPGPGRRRQGATCSPVRP